MSAIFWAVVRVGRCLLQSILLPLVLVADDRIFAASAFARALDPSERMRQEKHYWSVLNILRRAARRQERMNIRGQQLDDELQTRRDLRYAIRMHVTVLLYLFAFWYGTEALFTISHEHFPWLYELMVKTSRRSSLLLRSFWDLFPGP